MTRKFISNFLSVVEIRTKVVSVSTLILATVYVTWRKQFPSIIPYILMWVATLSVDMGTTAFNSYYDYWRGTDHYSDVNEKDKVLIHAGVEPGFAFFSALWCFVVALVFGFLLALYGNLWVIPSGLFCMCIGFLYTGGPYPISRTPFGELFAGLSLGLALFLISCGVWSLPFDVGVLIAGLPSVFWVASILAVNNTCDIEGDRASGRKTFSILVGAQGGEVAVILLCFFGQLTGILASLFGFLPTLVSITLSVGFVPIIVSWSIMHRRGYSHATKGANMKKILLCFLVFTVSYIVGFIPEIFDI